MNRMLKGIRKELLSMYDEMLQMYPKALTKGYGKSLERRMKEIRYTCNLLVEANQPCNSDVRDAMMNDFYARLNKYLDMWCNYLEFVRINYSTKENS